MDLDLVADYLATSPPIIADLRELRTNLQMTKTRVEAACDGAPETSALSRALDLFANFEFNDNGAQAIHDALSQLGAGGVIEVQSSDVAEALGEHGDAPSTVEYEELEFTGIPQTSGFVDDPICAANGNFIHPDTDTDTPGFAELIDVRRYYNSLDGHRSGHFGHGWTSMLDMELDYTDRSGIVRVRLEDGAIIPFQPIASTSAGDGAADEETRRWSRYAPRGLHLEQSGADVVLRQGHDQEWRFNSTGQLVSGGRGIARFDITRTDDEVVVAEANSGRSLRYELTPNGLVQQASTSDGRVVTYDYEDGHCVAVRRAIGDLTYVIGDDGLIAQIDDADGVLICHNTYDESGRVLSQRSPHGRETVYEYLKHGGTRIGDTGAGTTNLFIHDRRGRLTAMYDGLGAAMRQSWDHLDRITEHTDRAGDTTRFDYHRDDARDLLVRRIDADGLFEERAYDELDRLIARTDRAGSVEHFVYDGDRRVPSSIVGPEGGVVQISYDGRDLPAELTDADGVVTTFEWNADGKASRIIDASGAADVLSYDPAGRLIRLVNRDGGIVDIERESSGRVTRSENALAIATYVNSAAGRILACTDGDCDFTATYAEHGDLATAADATGATMRFAFDESAHLTQVIAADGATFSQEFDAAGNRVALVDSAGNRTEQSFDRAGRMVSQTDVDGRHTTREVDALGRTASITHPDGAVESFRYHPNGEIAEHVDPAGGVYTFEIDRLGRLTAETDPDGGRARFKYSPAGRLISHTTPAGRTSAWKYDHVGRMVSSVLADGDELVLEYVDGPVSIEDSAVTFETTPDGAVDRWSLASNDPFIDATADNSQTTTAAGTPLPLTPDSSVERDERGVTSAFIDPAGVRTEVVSDLRGRIIEAATAGHRTALGFDAAGQIATITNVLGLTTTNSSTPTGRLQSTEKPDGGGLDLAYNAAGRLETISPKAVGDETTLRYDARGNLSSATTAGVTQNVEHDHAGRLVSGQTLEGKWVDYRRDGDGIVTDRVERDGQTTSYRRTPTGLLIGFDDSAAGAVDLPAMAMVQTEAGRISVDGHGRTFRYDLAGRLAESATPAGDRYWFTYNDLGFLATDESPEYGRRVFHYNPAGQLLRTESSDETVEFAYDLAGRRASERSSTGATTTYHWDDLDHLVGITRSAADGSMSTRRVDYSPLQRVERVDQTTIGWDDAITKKPVRVGNQRYLRWGMWVRPAAPEGEWTDGTTDDPWGHHAAGDDIALGYRGELTIDGLVFMGARVYDPATRSFLSTDPLPQVSTKAAFLSAYTYVWNDPVNLVDPSGRSAVSLESFEDWRQRQENTKWGNAWDAITDDPWGSLATLGLVIIGGTLIFTGVGTAVGAGILVGVAVSASYGIATDNLNPTSVAISGAASGMLFGLGSSAVLTNTVGRGGVALLQGGVGAATSAADQTLAHGVPFGDINPASVAVSAVLSALPSPQPGQSLGRHVAVEAGKGGGESVAGQLAVGTSLDDLDLGQVAFGLGSGGFSGAVRFNAIRPEAPAVQAPTPGPIHGPQLPGPMHGPLAPTGPSTAGATIGNTHINPSTGVTITKITLADGSPGVVVPTPSGPQVVIQGSPIQTPSGHTVSVHGPRVTIQDPTTGRFVPHGDAVPAAAPGS